ncbi:ANTAR domain-containing response regulator [Pseudomonas typographi]|uniref:ANTAR domain-containing protein n=1 Tax=Pseudomonas typographi TaxID=2715964 RepID=A0ABR7Z2T3_9PSED|nr:ANTAR domain-containing protein [Pseudomonas typographi]MBD1599809.1 ANTAR domain-containing protein [Pseudomonas typographi]
MKARVFPSLEKGHLLLIDCDERSQASLGKSLQRLGIHGQALHQDAPCDTEGCFAAILEIEHFASPITVQALNAAAIPIIALSAHETLSQIHRALQLGATALLNKPITQGSVYTTLMMAVGLRDRQRADAEQLAELHRRLAQRPVLAQALARMIVSQHIDEATAYERLRSLSMQLNRPIEALCIDILAVRDEGRA